MNNDWTPPGTHRPLASSSLQPSSGRSRSLSLPSLHDVPSLTTNPSISLVTQPPSTSHQLQNQVAIQQVQPAPVPQALPSIDTVLPPQSSGQSSMYHQSTTLQPHYPQSSSSAYPLPPLPQSDQSSSTTDLHPTTSSAHKQLVHSPHSSFPSNPNQALHQSTFIPHTSSSTPFPTNHMNQNPSIHSSANRHPSASVSHPIMLNIPSIPPQLPRSCNPAYPSPQSASTCPPSPPIRNLTPSQMLSLAAAALIRDEPAMSLEERRRKVAAIATKIYHDFKLPISADWVLHLDHAGFERLISSHDHGFSNPLGLAQEIIDSLSRLLQTSLQPQVPNCPPNTSIADHSLPDPLFATPPDSAPDSPSTVPSVPPSSPIPLVPSLMDHSAVQQTSFSEAAIHAEKLRLEEEIAALKKEQEKKLRHQELHRQRRKKDRATVISQGAWNEAMEQNFNQSSLRYTAKCMPILLGIVGQLAFANALLERLEDPATAQPAMVLAARRRQALQPHRSAEEDGHAAVEEQISSSSVDGAPDAHAPTVVHLSPNTSSPSEYPWAAEIASPLNLLTQYSAFRSFQSAQSSRDSSETPAASTSSTCASDSRASMKVRKCALEKQPGPAVDPEYFARLIARIKDHEMEKEALLREQSGPSNEPSIEEVRRENEVLPREQSGPSSRNHSSVEEASTASSDARDSSYYDGEDASIEDDSDEESTTRVAVTIPDPGPSEGAALGNEKDANAKKLSNFQDVSTVNADSAEPEVEPPEAQNDEEMEELDLLLEQPGPSSRHHSIEEEAKNQSDNSIGACDPAELAINRRAMKRKKMRLVLVLTEEVGFLRYMDRERRNLSTSTEAAKSSSSLTDSPSVSGDHETASSESSDPSDEFETASAAHELSSPEEGGDDSDTVGDASEKQKLMTDCHHTEGAVFGGENDVGKEVEGAHQALQQPSLSPLSSKILPSDHEATPVDVIVAQKVRRTRKRRRSAHEDEDETPSSKRALVDAPLPSQIRISNPLGVAAKEPELIELEDDEDIINVPEDPIVQPAYVLQAYFQVIADGGNNQIDDKPGTSKLDSEREARRIARWEKNQGKKLVEEASIFDAEEAERLTHYLASSRAMADTMVQKYVLATPASRPPRSPSPACSIICSDSESENFDGSHHHNEKEDRRRMMAWILKQVCGSKRGKRICQEPGCRKTFTNNDRVMDHFMLTHRDSFIDKCTQFEKRKNAGRRNLQRNRAVYLH